MELLHDSDPDFFIVCAKDEARFVAAELIAADITFEYTHKGVVGESCFDISSTDSSEPVLLECMNRAKATLGTA